MPKFIWILTTIVGAFFLSAAGAQEIHITHCLKGCPIGTISTNDLIIREIYALSSNDESKFADWVAYRVTRETIGTSSSLDRDWKPDPALEANETLEEDDYKNANSAHKYDKGHQAPLASFAGTVFWRSTNFLSNITPQKADLNQGPWVDLESKVRHAAYHLGEVYVVTGPLYAPGVSMPVLPNADEPHVVPTGYWKVIATDNGRVSAFTFRQDTPRSDNYCEHRTTLADVETQSGLDIFPQALDWPTGDLDADLGC